MDESNKKAENPAVDLTTTVANNEIEAIAKEDDLRDKEDGMRLLIEPCYTFGDLQEYIKDTCLAEKLKFIDEALLKSLPDEHIEYICKELLKLLNGELNFEEIMIFFVVASMVYFIDRKPSSLELRKYLLQKTFSYTDTLHPVHLHFAAKYMWNGLNMQKEDRMYVLTIINICQQISLISETGLAVALCLMWAILAEISTTDFEMYRFYKFSDLFKMLQEMDDELLREENKLQIVYVLVQTIGFLVNVVVFGESDFLKKAGYRSYFVYKRRDLEKIKEWVEKLSENLTPVVASKAKNFWEFRMAIIEYVNSNLTSILHDKILELQTFQVK